MCSIIKNSFRYIAKIIFLQNQNAVSNTIIAGNNKNRCGIIQ